MNERIIRKISIILVILGLIFNFSMVAAEPYVGEDDEYTKKIELGSSEEFYWVIYKNSTENYSVSVHIEDMDGWSYDINPSDFVLSESNSYQKVIVTVTVPKYPEKEQRNASVIFTYRELNSPKKYEIIKEIQVGISGISYSGEENSIIGGFTNPLPVPLNNPYGALILNIIIWLIIAFVLYIFIKYIIHAFVRKTKTKLDDAIVEIIRTPILVLVIIYGILSSILRLGVQIGIQESLYQFFSFFVLGVAVYIVYKIYNEILEEISIRRGGESSTFAKVLRPIFRIIGALIIIIGGLIYGLSIFGIEVTVLLAGAGILGLVISFAAQDTLSNFFSGMYLLLDRPFQIGDLILLESGEYCRVESVGMRSIRLYSLFDDELIILPNNMMANQKIINIVKPDTHIRQRIEVGVAYGSDVEKVKKILYDAATNHPDVLTDGDYEPLVRFTDFGDSSLDFLLIFTVNDVMKQWKTRSDIVTEIDKRFREENVTIPFPQRTIWFNKVQRAKKEKNDVDTPDNR